MTIEGARPWLGRAHCASQPTSLFFVEYGPKSLTEPSARAQRAWDRAKDFCYDCPVMLQCADSSLGEVDGVWGGLDPAQRYQLRVEKARHIRSLPPQERAHYGRRVYNLRRKQDVVWPEVARLVGINVSTARYLLTWYTGYLKETADGATSHRKQDAGGGNDPAPVVLHAHRVVRLSEIGGAA